MQRCLVIALWVSATLLVFALGFLVGAGQALDLMRRQAVDEGFAVVEKTEDGDEHFRWRTTEELERRPARRKQ